MPLAKLSSKSQIVLPAELRRRLGLSPGDLVEISADGDRIILQKAPASFVDALERCGSELWSGQDRALGEAREQWKR